MLRPGGVLYFEVNIHHSLYHAAASLHAAWRALGIRFEITPFADHTVHLTLDAARALFKGLPFRLVRETTIYSRRSDAPRKNPSGMPEIG